METRERLDLSLIEEFVTTCHGDLARVLELLELQPALVNAAWDWGAGDWETGLGGAAHMGRRDIALALLDAGGRLDIFAAAMLGLVDVVRAAVMVSPHIPDVLGPHGIPLIAHAQVGGAQAKEVVDFLKDWTAKST